MNAKKIKVLRRILKELGQEKIIRASKNRLKEIYNQLDEKGKASINRSNVSKIVALIYKKEHEKQNNLQKKA